MTKDRIVILIIGFVALVIAVAVTGLFLVMLNFGGDDYTPYIEAWQTAPAEETTPIITTPPPTEAPFVPAFYHHPYFDDNQPNLSMLTVTHIDFDGNYQLGHIIVATAIADEVIEIFQEIFEARFPIHSIIPISYFDGSDYHSMAANNSHAFNFRYIAGTTTLSRHARGMAIDINPVQNPYIRGDTIWPADGIHYLDRTNIRPGMVTPGDAVYTAFTSRGWTWGGNWRNPIDYHHFERR